MSTQSRLDTCPRCSGPPTWKTSSRTSPLDLVQSHSSGRLKYPRLFCVDCKLPLTDMHSATAESYPFEGFGMYPIEISSIRFQDIRDIKKCSNCVQSSIVRGPNSGEVRPSYMYASFVLDAYVSQNIGDTCVFQNKTRLKYLTHARVSK